MRIKNVRLREKYGEGEVPYDAKTGSGPILLTFSFPYVRDWLNEHPFKNEPNTRLVCNLTTGGPVKPNAIWDMMRQLKIKIKRLLDNNEITDKTERERLQYLVNTKKWNPYCIRHSSITNDSDYLPEYALKKKVRWSMNSRQGTRYIKTRLGNELKEKILQYNGITSENEYWLAKYELLKDDPNMCLIYVGLKQLKRFPVGIELVIYNKIKELKTQTLMQDLPWDNNNTISKQ